MLGERVIAVVYDVTRVRVGDVLKPAVPSAVEVIDFVDELLSPRHRHPLEPLVVFRRRGEPLISSVVRHEHATRSMRRPREPRVIREQPSSLQPVHNEDARRVIPDCQPQEATPRASWATVRTSLASWATTVTTVNSTRIGSNDRNPVAI